MKRKSKAYFDFLDILRASGRTNMYGATPFLQDEFPELSYQEAVSVLQAWMTSFPREENGA